MRIAASNPDDDAMGIHMNAGAAEFNGTAAP